MIKKDKIMIELKSDIYKVTKILKQSKVLILKDIVIGDKIIIKTNLQHIERGVGLYASEFEIINLRTGESYKESQTNVSNRLQSFELEKENQNE